MDSKELYQIIIKKLGKEWYMNQENEILLVLLKKKEKDEKFKEKEFENLLKFIDTCKSSLSIEDEAGEEQQKVYEETITTLKSLKNDKKKKEKIEPKEISREFHVANSNIFPSKHNSSSWAPKCFVATPISFSKRLEISPDVYDDEDGKSVLNLIYKSRGLFSDSKPLAIPFSPHEFKENVLASLIMMTLFDSTSILQFELISPQDCNDILSKWNDETTAKIGNHILSYFDLDAIKLGILFKKHLENISQADKKHVTVDEKNMKRKGGEEHLLDIWANRKKAFLKYSAQKNENKK